MKIFIIYVMNTMAVYGRTARQTCRPIELLFYTYNDEEQVSALSYGGYNAAYTYDKQGRLTNKTSGTAYRTWLNENYVYQKVA